jgi:baseplate hub protein gp41
MSGGYSPALVGPSGRLDDPYQAGPNNSDQWIRRWTLVLSGPGGSETISQDVPNIPDPTGVSTADDGLRITFSVTQNRVHTPGRANIKVYNTRLDTPLATLAQQYNRVVLSVGYVSGYFGVIFDGAIAYFRRGREQNLVDTFLQIMAQAGDWALNGTVASQTFAAGTTETQVGQQMAAAMVANGVQLAGAVAGMATVALPRGQVHYGRATDIVRDLGGSLFVERNQLRIYDPKNPIPGATVVLNSLTGLVGMPEQTDQGVELVALINPSVRIMGTVQVDQSSINQVAAGTGNIASQRQNEGEGFFPVLNGIGPPGWFATTTADGLYTVYSIEYEGDSRGVPWYMKIICNAQGQALPPGSITLTNAPPDLGLGPTQGQLQNLNSPENSSNPGSLGGSQV